MGINYLVLPYPLVNKSKIRSNLFRVASWMMALALFAMVMIPLLEAGGRRFLDKGIHGAAGWVQHLTLWLGLLGAILAAFRRRHLAIATAEIFQLPKFDAWFKFLSGAGAVPILVCLTWASFVFAAAQRISAETIGGWLPIWIAQMSLPIAFLFMTIATLLRSTFNWRKRLALLALGVLLAPLLSLLPVEFRALFAQTAVALILMLAFLGMPLYVVLGGIGAALFFAADIPIAAIPAETYRIVTQPVLPSIPLFALAGTVLAAGGAPKTLVRLVQAWTNWLPAGPAISTLLGCAIFTAMTGASGVTILALGSLLLPVLVASRHQEKFGIGLLTASGSVGLLFPPSLPVILYGVYAHVPIDQLFLAALAPGFLLIFMLAGFSWYRSRRHHLERTKFDLREALSATWAARGYLLLPIVIAAGLFGGVMTLVETAALTAFLAILLEAVFSRHLDLRKGLPQAMIESAVVVGALLAVMGTALGLVSYMVDAEIPQRATEWVQSAIHSKLVFLLVMNGLLLVVGSLMDVFSAIVVVAPLIAPMGAAFGVDPVHLGIIFLANLELGYLTPPVGMNLFLSSLRFQRPLITIWRTVTPFLFIFLVWVLLITYFPGLTLGTLNVFR